MSITNPAPAFRITSVLADAEFVDNSTLRTTLHRMGLAYGCDRGSRELDTESQHLRGPLRHSRAYGVQQRANPLQLLRRRMSLIAIEAFKPPIEKASSARAHAIIRVRQRLEKKCGGLPFRRFEEQPKQVSAGLRG